MLFRLLDSVQVSSGAEDQRTVADRDRGSHEAFVEFVFRQYLKVAVCGHDNRPALGTEEVNPPPGY